ncbi:MAG: protein kinase [Acidobacteria bacterium]|nr:protein kinase [Acidobacteriota bacterium]
MPSDEPSTPVTGGFLPAGSRVHGYVIERLAAVGGAAAVYEARDPALGRTVALKVLHRSLDPGQWGWRGLESEGRRTVRLEHPAFVTVYELFPHRGGTALVMEWVEGCTLAERLARGPLAPGEARRIFVELASALAAAHAAGLVHGDLSPANVMIGKGDRIKVLDPVPPAPSGSEGGGSVTRPYAAPEVLATGRPSPAGDVYAFGAMLDEALPEGGRWIRGTRALRRLARRCLHGDPGRRPADGGGLVEALEPVSTPLSSLSRRTLLALTAALAAAGAVGFLWGSWMARRPGGSHESWNGVERLHVGGSLPALLEDGSAVVYRSPDDRGIEILPLASGVARTVWHGTAPITDVVVCPGGRNVLFVSPAGDGEPWLWEVAMDGGFPRRIAPGTASAISADGRKVAAIQPVGNGLRRIVVLDRDGTMLRPLHTFQRSLVPVSLVFGPGGRTVIVGFTDGIRRSGLLEISLDDGSARTLIEVPGVATAGAAMHPALGTVVWPVRTVARGDASLVATRLRAPALGVVYQGPGRASHPSLDRRGDLLAFQLTEIDTELVELAVTPGNGPPVSAMEVLPGSRGTTQPRIGPDPSFLLFQSSTGTVQIMNRLTGQIRGLLTVGTAQYNPGWSPDGKLTVCACLADGRSDLWVVPAEGGAPERLTAGAGNNFQPVWHPDGRHILFISDREDVDDLYELDLRDGRVLRLGKDGGVNPAVSSDGRYVAYVVGAYGPSPRLRLARLGEGVDSLETVWERPVAVDRWAGAKARFSPDGHWLAFDQPRENGGADIWAVPVANGGTARAVRLTALPFLASLTGWFDWGPDWKIVATVARRTDRICILHDATSWLRHAR